MRKRLVDLIEALEACHPKIARGIVWCIECGRSQRVDTACFRTGWPTCCGYTMTIDSPEERQQLSQASIAPAASTSDGESP